MKTTLKIAGFVFEIEHRYQLLRSFCKDYLCDAQADYCLSISDADLQEEREWLGLLQKDCDPQRAAYSDEHVELLMTHRKIAAKLLEHDIIMFHGSAVAVDGETYLFTAISGTGKSTHTRLWREVFGSRAVMVNDDKPWIRVTEAGASVIGGPWNGKHRLSSDVELPLKAICLLERSEDNHIHAISGREMWPMLFQQVHRPPEAEKMTRTLQLVDRLSRVAKFYRLGCNMDPEAARIAYEGMQSIDNTN